MFQPLQRTLAAAAIFLLPALVTAGESAQQASDEASGGEAPVVRLNVSTDGYPPYLIVSPEHEYSGIAYDVVTRIAERMGYRVEALEIPRKRVDNLLQEGVVDATLRAREWTREPDNFLFTDTIVPIREVFFTTTDSSFHFQGLDKLSDVTLVTPLGYHYPQLKPLFDSGALERYEVSRDRDIFTFMLHGRNIDAGVADLLVGQWLIRQHGWQGKFRHSEQAISEFNYRLMVRPDWALFAERFNKQLEQMKASGELEQILDQYR
ncbi:substrate-binding periplasmic protein [Marinobacter lacisalsi]|uniref:Substrate-binding periplasmic protein n=1 Tax=Marinobacter lacisalsi TaxID=475979 RepID=A0ABV8QHA2_9GAMM